MTKPRILVLAGNHTQYHNWLRDRGYNPNEYVYLTDATIRGVPFGTPVQLVGTWQDNPLASSGLLYIDGNGAHVK